MDVSRIIKSNFDLIYACLLFFLLLFISFPSLSFPPLSDTWEMLHFFHSLDELPGHMKWLHILNHDPNEHMRYQPFSRIFFYAFHLMFGSNFTFFNIFNFLAYFSSVLLLYRFALYFCKDRALVAGFTWLFAFLANHFDIALWSYHIYILAGFSFLLLGFISYIRYLNSKKLLFLFFASLFLLSGALCYEAFLLWPLGIIILCHIKTLKTQGAESAGNTSVTTRVALGSIYLAYLLFYLFCRSLGTYASPAHDISAVFKLSNLSASAALVLFSTLYNNVIINIIPWLPVPFNVTENIYMAGAVVNYFERGHQWGILLIGAALGVLLISLGAYFLRRRHFEELKVMGFFTFLIFSTSYIIFFCRMAFNGGFVYNLTEFRYQYIPNACLTLVTLYAVERFLKPPGSRKRMILSFLAVVFVFNLYCIHRLTGIYDQHFFSLKKMIYNIKEGIAQGRINALNKIYIDEEMPDYLPHLCWNIDMGVMFIPKGNYKWMFSKKEISYFADDQNYSTWRVDKRDFSVILKTEAAAEAGRINVMGSGWYIAPGKDLKYASWGLRYMGENRYPEAIKMFKRALKLNPQNNEAYAALQQIAGSLNE